MYRSGEGTEAQATRAVDLAAPVAERGYAVGNQLHEGLQSVGAEDYGRAIMTYLAAAEAGSEVAQFNVFHIIDQERAAEGSIPPRLLRLYLRYVRLSARTSPKSMTVLAHLRWFGDHGVRQDRSRALGLYRRAAARGEPEATFNLVRPGPPGLLAARTFFHPWLLAGTDVRGDGSPPRPPCHFRALCHPWLLQRPLSGT